VSQRAADVIIVGGGIVGLSAARALAGAGRKVVLLERRRVAAEASGAAAGMLAPQAEAGPGWPLLPLALQAREHHRALAAALESETGIPVELSQRGAIEVARTREEASHLEKKAAWQKAQGLSAEMLSARELHATEPNLSPQIAAGLVYRDDHWIDNHRLCRALAASALARGAGLICGRPVTQLLSTSSRVCGVRAGGEVFEAPVVVNAAGAWAGLLSGDPAPPPVEPVRGQMLALDVAVAPVRHVITSTAGYIVPRLDGRLLVGSTSERAGFDKSVTAGGLRALLSNAVELIPSLADVRVSETWAGLRPGTPDGLPVVGPGALDGLFHAAGLYRNGILLGPTIGEILADLVLGRPVAADLTPFALTRFSR
jgi:glycine oxidase